MKNIIKFLFILFLVVATYIFLRNRENFSIVDTLRCGQCSTTIDDDGKIWPHCRRKGLSSYLGASLDLPPICSQ